MTTKQEKILQTVEGIYFNVRCLVTDYASYVDYEHEHNCVRLIYLERLRSEISDKLYIIKDVFSVDYNEAMILAALMHCEMQYGIPKSEFIVFKDLLRFYQFDFSSSLYFQFRESIYSLEEKGLIEIDDFDYYPVPVVDFEDQKRNEHYLIPVKPSFMPFTGKKFSLSAIVLKKLID